MGLKNKIGEFIRKVTDLNGGEAKSKAGADSITGKKISFDDLSKKLVQEREDGKYVLGRRVLVPDYYVILLNPKDMEKMIESEKIERILIEELTEQLYNVCKKHDQEKKKENIVIEVNSDEKLDSGKFRIEYKMEAPKGKSKSVSKEPGDRGLHTVIEAKKDETVSKKKNDKGVSTVIEKEKAVEEGKTMPKEKPVDTGVATVVKPERKKPLYKIEVDDGKEKRTAKISKKRISIGRHTEDDDIYLDDPEHQVSRGHAKLELRDSRFFLTPYGVNGTFLNGEELELEKEAEVSSEDVIKIENYSLRIIQ